MLIQCPARVGKYTVLRHLSAGGMADLYEARLLGIEDFKRSIAIKVVRKPEELTEDEAKTFVSMFIDEARVCGQLNHANICQVYELGKFNGLPYMAMELIEGHSLSQVRRKASALELPIPIPFVAYVVSQTALGLDHAHRRSAIDGTPLNIVHRDVSPDNILISYEGEVKLIDFGVAFATHDHRKEQGNGLRGKLPYMAPEQARQEQVDARADIFGLGAILFELLTGRRLYLSSGAELFLAAREALIPDLNRTLSDVPTELADVVRRCLAKDRNQRYSTAADVSKALAPYIITGRSLYGAEDTARMVAAVFPEKPNQRRAEATATPGPESDAIRTEVLQTFDAAFYKRETVEVDPEEINDALKPRRRIGLVATAAAVFVASAALAVTLLGEEEPPPEPATEGFIVFSFDEDTSVRMSINDAPLQSPPGEPVPLPFGPHKIHFQVLDGKKVLNARQTVEVTQRHTRERPLKVALRPRKSSGGADRDL